MFKLGSIGISYLYNNLFSQLDDDDDEKSDDYLVNNFNRLKIIRKTLEQHGGIFSKIAQMLSYGELNSSVFTECQPYSKKETTEYLEKYIENGDKEYILDFNIYKSGSVGQVYIGEFKTNSEFKGKIAIKVQYIGLYEQTEKDINALNLLSNFLYSFTDVKEAIKDIKKKIYEELDYIIESENHNIMYNLWKDSDIYIPKVYTTLCTEKILITEFIDGDDLSIFINKSSQEEKNKISRDLVKFMFTNIYKHAIFYSDCHYGNIIIHKNCLSIIDFGCINYIDKKMLNSLKKLHRYLKEEDKDMVINVLIELDILNDNVSKESLEYAYNYFRLQYRPWIIEKEFEFTKEWFEEADKKNTKLMSEWKLPQNMVYFNKIPWGFYHILVSLNSKAEFYKIIDNII
jgi:predicted unusual protein kinase regulating ubiquinone biosynthesis (AarF/ABC1/UbiB family)